MIAEGNVDTWPSYRRGLSSYGVEPDRISAAFTVRGCDAIWTRQDDNSRENLQNVRGENSARAHGGAICRDIQEFRARVLVIHARRSAMGESCRSRTRFLGPSTQAIRFFQAVTS